MSELGEFIRANNLSYFPTWKKDPSIPLVCVCGNHDVGDQPTRKSIQRYIEHFGDDYFDFYCGGVHCIVINSQFYVHSMNVEDLKREHEEWLDRVIKDKQSTVKHTILFQHIPWFLNCPDQKKDYFNMETETQMKILEKFHAAGKKQRKFEYSIPCFIFLSRCKENLLRSLSS